MEFSVFPIFVLLCNQFGPTLIFRQSNGISINAFLISHYYRYPDRLRRSTFKVSQKLLHFYLISEYVVRNSISLIPAVAVVCDVFRTKLYLTLEDFLEDSFLNKSG